MRRRHENNGRAATVSARGLYRDYLIELHQNELGWCILRIAHCLTEANSFVPACVYYRERAAAEEGGRALIDARLSGKRLGSKGEVGST